MGVPGQPGAETVSVAAALLPAITAVPDASSTTGTAPSQVSWSGGGGTLTVILNRSMKPASGSVLSGSSCTMIRLRPSYGER